jgi:chemotaxis regulatin CheY-phosphate phosphatase CheZ
MPESMGERTVREIADHLHSLDVVDEPSADAARRVLEAYERAMQTPGLADEGVAIMRRHATILRTKLSAWEAR